MAILPRKIFATSGYEPDMKYTSLISLLCLLWLPHWKPDIQIWWFLLFFSLMAIESLQKWSDFGGKLLCTPPHLRGNHPQEDILKNLNKLAILARKILATSSYEPDMKYNSLISLVCFMATHWKPNIQIWRFLLYFSLIEIENL